MVLVRLATTESFEDAGATDSAYQAVTGGEEYGGVHAMMFWRLRGCLLCLRGVQQQLLARACNDMRRHAKLCNDTH